MTQKDSSLETSKTFYASGMQTGGPIHSSNLNLTSKDLSMNYDNLMDSKKLSGEILDSGQGSPFKENNTSKAAGLERDRQLTRMARTLRQKIEEVIKVEDLNKQLKDKLKVYQDQNDKNVDIAKLEIDRINHELSITTNQKKKLEDEVKQIKNLVQETSTQNQILINEREDMVKENLYLRSVEHELRLHQSLEEKSDVAYRFYQRKILRAYLDKLRIANVISKRMEQIKFRFQIYSTISLVNSAFRAFQRNAIIEKILKHRSRERSVMNMAHKFAAWKMYMRTEKIKQYFDRRRINKNGVTAFVVWKQYCKSRKNKAKIKDRVKKYHEVRVQKTVFEWLKQHWKKYTIPKEVSMHYQGIALAQYFGWLMRLNFYKLQKYTREVALPKRIRNRMAAYCYKKNLQTMGFKLLIANCNRYAEIKEKAEEMRAK